LHEYLLNIDICSCITDIDMTLLLPVGYEYTMCGTKCRMERSATRSEVPHHKPSWWGPPLEFVKVSSKIHGCHL